MDKTQVLTDIDLALSKVREAYSTSSLSLGIKFNQDMVDINENLLKAINHLNRIRNEVEYG